ncbi:hypothetical protein IPJ72_03480 [Candidatus Peregrinibacteria bacterium]|nr:MAG: hypothetical protein IPJ72_03480 [Candidatus Peregrinibacteria bacterium]
MELNNPAGLFEEEWQQWFKELRYAENGSVQMRASEWLRQRLARNHTEAVLQSYLREMEWYFEKDQIKNANQSAKKWLSQWVIFKPKDDLKAWESQARQANTLISLFADRIDSETMEIANEIGTVRMAKNTQEDAWLEVAQERLNLSKRLVVNYRYEEAKNYLISSYDTLNLSGSDSSRAAVEVFVKEGALLVDRITFAEKTLRGAAAPIDEKEFQDYLKKQAEEQTLTDRFSRFLAGAVDVTQNQTTLEEIQTEFSRNGLVVSITDITKLEKPQQFRVEKIRAVLEGRNYELGGEYDAASQTLSQVSLSDGKKLSGNFLLKDIGTLLKRTAQSQNETDPSAELLQEFLSDDTEQTNERSTIVAQDLAIKLATLELAEFNLTLPSAQSIQLANKTNLDEFNLKGIQITNPLLQKILEVDFHYQSSTHLVSNINVKDHDDIVWPTSLSLEKFLPTLMQVLEQKQAEEQLIQSVLKRLERFPIQVNATQIAQVETTGNSVRLEGVKIKLMPITFSATYDYEKDRLMKVESDQYSEENQSVEQALNQMMKRYLIRTFQNANIAIQEKTSIATYPPM